MADNKPLLLASHGSVREQRLCFGCRGNLPLLGQGRKTGLELWGMSALSDASSLHQPPKNPGAGQAGEPPLQLPSASSSRSIAELEVCGWALGGLILAFSYTVFSFLTQNVWTAKTDGLADTTNRPANTTHTRCGELSPTSWPSGRVYKTAKWKPKDWSLIPPVKSSRFLLATSHLISINESWPSSPNLAESCKAEA